MFVNELTWEHSYSDSFALSVAAFVLQQLVVMETLYGLQSLNTYYLALYGKNCLIPNLHHDPRCICANILSIVVSHWYSLMFVCEYVPEFIYLPSDGGLFLSYGYYDRCCCDLAYVFLCQHVVSFLLGKLLHVPLNTWKFELLLMLISTQYSY